MQKPGDEGRTCSEGQEGEEGDGVGAKSPCQAARYGLLLLLLPCLHHWCCVCEDVLDCVKA